MNRALKIAAYTIAAIIALMLFTNCTISIALLLPYINNYMDGHYLIEPNDLPSFKELYNNIFVSLSILATSIFSFLLYKTSERQRKNAYEDKFKALASSIFYDLKFYIMGKFTNLMINNESRLLFKHKKTKEILLTSTTGYEVERNLRSRIAEVSYYLKDAYGLTDLDVQKLFAFALDVENLRDINYVFNSEIQSVTETITDGEKMYFYSYEFIIRNNTDILEDSYKMILKHLIK